jgi:hypothetical protein
MSKELIDAGGEPHEFAKLALTLFLNKSDLVSLSISNVVLVHDFYELGLLTDHKPVHF